MPLMHVLGVCKQISAVMYDTTFHDIDMYIAAFHRWFLHVFPKFDACIALWAVIGHV